MERGGPRLERRGPRLERSSPRLERCYPRLERGGPRLERGGPRLERGGPRLKRGGPRPEMGGPRLASGQSKILLSLRDGDLEHRLPPGSHSELLSLFVIAVESIDRSHAEHGVEDRWVYHKGNWKTLRGKGE